MVKVNCNLNPNGTFLYSTRRISIPVAQSAQVRGDPTIAHM